MEKFLSRKSKNIKSALGTKSNIKYKKLSITKEVSSPRFGTGSPNNQNSYNNINLFLSKNIKSIFNHKTQSKNISNVTNSLTNSNILMKSTEQNLISLINNDILFSKISLSNINDKSSKEDSPSIKSGSTFTINKKNKFRHFNKTKIENSKIIKDIEKENNKIISVIKKQRRKSEVLTPDFNKYNFTKALFKFGKNKKKKKSKFSYSPLKVKNSDRKSSLKKRRQTIFSERESLQIKSFQNISSEISKKLRRKSIIDLKNEIKKLENLDINNFIEKTPKSKETKSSRGKSLEQTNLSYDIIKFRKQIIEFEYQKKFRNLFLCKNLYDSLDDDENEDLDKLNTFYIGPNDISCYIIDSLNLIASLISLIYIPYFLVYELGFRRFHFYTGTHILFTFIDLVYLIDLLSGFIRAFYNFEEILIIKKRYMVLNYLKSWFFLDFLEAIPFFVMFNLSQEDCHKKECKNLAFGNNLNYSFLLLKILKIFKLNKNSAFKAIYKFLNKSSFISDWKGVFENIFIVLCSLHLVSCYFIFLGKNI